MKDLILGKKFGTEGEYTILQAKHDTDDFALKYYDKVLDITLIILAGGDTDGGSIPNIAKGVFDPLLDKTAHGFIFHDELWRHRVALASTYSLYSISFTETNRIMKDIHEKAGCGWFEKNLTRLGVRWGGYWKWTHPAKRIRDVKSPTLLIKKGK